MTRTGFENRQYTVCDSGNFDSTCSDTDEVGKVGDEPYVTVVLYGASSRHVQSCGIILVP